QLALADRSQPEALLRKAVQRVGPGEVLTRQAQPGLCGQHVKIMVYRLLADLLHGIRQLAVGCFHPQRLDSFLPFERIVADRVLEIGDGYRYGIIADAPVLAEDIDAVKRGTE